MVSRIALVSGRTMSGGICHLAHRMPSRFTSSRQGRSIPYALCALPSASASSGKGIGRGELAWKLRSVAG